MPNNLYFVAVNPFRFAFLLVCLCAFSCAAFAQEVCGNCIDDDNDGYIDCFDTECFTTTGCDSFYGQPTPLCQFVPTNPQFSLIEDWSGGPATGHSPVFCGDLDNDGMPEVLVRYLPNTVGGGNQQNGAINTVRIFNGATGALEYTPNTMHIPYTNNGFCLADADRDGNGEFYYITAANTPGGDDKKIVCYEYDAGVTNFTLKWISNTRVLNNTFEVFFSVDIADFNSDGVPELYAGNQIFNALTGVEIASGGVTNSVGFVGNSAHNSAFPVAADVLSATTLINGTPCGAPCDGLELVAGNQVYAVDIAAQTVQVVVQAANGLPDGGTAVVDYDLDGDLDGVVAAENIAGQSSIYVWDLQTGAQIGSVFPISNSQLIGRPTVGDFDADGKPEIGACGRDVYRVMDDYQSAAPHVLWSLATNDNSGRTGATIFDFEGDGVSEIVYRDEARLRILNGTTGATLASIPCTSPTANEYPIVVDVDMDGEAEILCTCGGGTGTVKAYKTAGSSWVPARSVWNQHAYFIMNINDDLTVPACQQAHHPEFPQAGSGKRPFNMFLAQATMLNDQADISFAAADATITVDAVNCNGGSVDVQLRICNQGDNTLPDNIPVRFYNANPTTGSATTLFSFTTTASIPVGACTTATVNIATPQGTVYVFVNDAGTTPRPYNCTTDFPNTTVGECDFCNNIDSFNASLTTLQVDTAICQGESYLAGGAQQTTAGLYYDTLMNTAGCDTVVVTNLAVLPDTVVDVFETICMGDSFLAGGSYQTTGGIYPDSLLNSNSCDSIVLTHLTVLPVAIVSISEIICAGDSFPAGGAYQTTSGVYIDSFLGANLCDSIIITNLTVLPDTLVHVFITRCAGDSVLAGGANQTVTGVYTDSLLRSTMCDSIVLTHLTMLADTTVHVNDERCAGDTVFVGGAHQTTTGDYTDSLLNSALCDSVVITHLTFHLLAAESIDDTICRGESISVGTSTYSETGIYTDTLQTGFGCDSIITLNLLVNPLDTFILDVTICTGASLTVGDSVYSEAGSYINVFTIPDACDSMVFTTLAFLPAITDTFYDTILTGQVYNGILIPADTILVEQHETTEGCDSLRIIYLTVEEVMAIIPTAFSPNGDGRNDVFRILTEGGEVESARLLVFNRWGEKVFESNDITQGWDGTYKGVSQDIGVYAYFAEVYFVGSPKSNTLNGNVTLVR